MTEIRSQMTDVRGQKILNAEVGVKRKLHEAWRRVEKTGRRSRKEENNSGVCIRIKITDYSRQIHERIEIFFSRDSNVCVCLCGSVANYIRTKE